MNGKVPNAKIILGLKLRQLRQEQGLSFAELAARTGLSVSYLNEIEKGKKYPKEDKIALLAGALGASPEVLTSGELDRSLLPVTELLQSNFLSELPLDRFGIELSKVVEIIAEAPLKVGAFIATLLQLSRNYNVREENFYFGAVRAYLELNNNYFEEIERAVDGFKQQQQLSAHTAPSAESLQRILMHSFGYQIVENGLEAYPALSHVRSVFLPDKKHLLLNGSLSGTQRAFQLGKELGFNVLQLKERAYTASLLKGRNFEEVLNHAKAIYFSVALLMDEKNVVNVVKTFLDAPRWSEAGWLSLLERYGATPEMLYHRLTNILPRFLGLSELFFLRFVHNVRLQTYTIDKELHFSRRHHPHGTGLAEHYCRRWVALSSLEDLKHFHNSGQVIARVQRSHYVGTRDEYLCFTLAHKVGEEVISLTLGLLINDQLKQSIRFWDDPGIPFREVNQTCERCTLAACRERAAPPVIAEHRARRKQVQEVLNTLLDKK